MNKTTLKLLILFLLIITQNFAQTGTSCNDPIQITSFPYITQDDTANYLDLIDGVPGTGCGSTNPYLNGNEVFYKITPTSTNSITISSQTNSTWSGLFVYNSCANVGVSCVVGSTAGNGTTNADSVTFTPTVGQEYFVVISTFATSIPQTVPYTLTVVENSCTNMTANFSVVSNCTSGTDTFFVNANVTNMGSAVSILGTTTPVSNSQTLTSAGQLQFGPFPNGTDVTVNLQNQQNANCFRNSISLTQEFCPAPNNLCADAIALNCNSSISGTTQGSTSVGTPTTSCGTPPNNSPGVWYTFLGNGDVTTFSLCGSTFDTKMQILTGSCGAFTCVAGNNDFCGTQSEVQIATTTGTLYYIYVFGVNNTTSGTFDLNTTCVTPSPPPANDECSNAISISVNPYGIINATSGSVSGATPSIQANSCTGSADDDVWYSFVATQTTHIIELNNIFGSTLDLNHALYTSTNSSNPCGNLSQITCSDLNYSFNTGLVVGQTYYIRIYTAVSVILQDTSFDLYVSELPPTSPNDECSSAIVIPVNDGLVCNSTFNAYIFNATASSQVNSCTNIANDDVWYKFIATSVSHKIEYSNISGTTSNLTSSLYSGDCNSINNLGCYTSNSKVYNNLIIGQEYYLRIYTSTQTINQFAQFTICITNPLTVCIESQQIYNNIQYNNIVNVPSIGSVGCLNTTPNPNWFYFQVNESGNLTADILQTNNLTGNPIDVDFICWGPFTSGNANNFCNNLFDFPDGNNLIPNNIVDCSYSASAFEQINIPNANEGEYYVLMITNFNGTPGVISLNLNFDTSFESIVTIPYVDVNNNSLFDLNEYTFVNGSFNYTINNLANPIYTSNTNIGNLIINPDNSTDTYDINYTIDSPFNNYLNSNYSLNDISYSNVLANVYYFPITITNPFSDVSVNIVGTNQPRPNLTYKNRIIYKNNGVSTTSGTISFTKDTNVTITNISNTSAVLNSTGFTLDYTNLLPQETRFVDVIMSVPNVPIVDIDDVLTNSASITSTVTDIDLLNNNSNINQIVVNSYDPNDKMESHGESININSFTTNDYLYYTIRFQNIGTANAINIRIEDTLDPQLDASSIRMINASHNYTLIREGNQLTWNFVGINLPGISQSEELSQGYVTFKIKPNPGFAVNDMIPNTAEIYFDSNPAIITNTFQTTFVNTLSNENFLLNEILIYPNPTNDILNINYGTNNIDIKSIGIHDMLGKKVYQNNSKVESIDLSNFNSGIYLIEISTENNGKITKKLIKN